MRRSPAGGVAYAALVAFATYSCMYAFRKPFDATTFASSHFLGTFLELKTACVLAQVVGYCLSKYLGAKVCAEVPGVRVGRTLVGLILAAEAGLVLFAVLPADAKPFAMLMNGLPLGMVWGLCVRYLEGRRATEVLIAAMSCAFVVAGAVSRDIGRDVVMGWWGVPEAWMPAATGLLFLGPFVVCVNLMGRIPAPTTADISDRGERKPMPAATRRAFVRHYGWGFGLLVAAYFFLTAFRDFRDHYGKEIFTALGYGDGRAVFTRTEWLAGVGVLAALAGVSVIRRHRAAVAVVCGVIAGGFAVVGVAAILYLSDVIDGFTMMVLFAVGLYLAYVPFGAVLFERLMAARRFAGTAAFAIQLADAVGYTGSAAVQVLRDFAFGRFDRLQFVVPLGLVVAAAGMVLTITGGVLCVRRAGPSGGEPGRVV